MPSAELADLMADLNRETARKIIVWQIGFFAALLTLSALVNSYSVVADSARAGHPVPLRAPLTWEFSSGLVIGLLIPVQAWWLARFPFGTRNRWRTVSVHLLTTVPYSIFHVEGMIQLRRVVYWSLGAQYDFGPFWTRWLYEYRKDFLSYWLVIGMLLAFRVYGLWLDARQENGSNSGVEGEPSRQSPLDRLVVRKLNREFILNTGDIDRVEADGNYVVIHACGQSYRLRGSLADLVQRMGPQRFARVHRAHVVNVDRVREIQPWDHGDYRIVLKDGSFVNLSRRYRKDLERLFV